MADYLPASRSRTLPEAGLISKRESEGKALSKPKDSVRQISSSATDWLYLQLERQYSVPPRLICAGLFLTGLMSLGTRFLPEGNALLNAMKLVPAALLAGLLPGMLIVLITKPLQQISLLQAIVFGLAISLGLAQISTMIAEIFRIATLIIVFAEMSVCLLALIYTWLRASREAVLTVSFAEIVLLLMLLVLALILYFKGAPAYYPNVEDLTHLSVIRRLAFISHPAIDNVYFAPNVPYTYPFPGIHYFYAMVSRIAELDPLVVYHKMRFFWSPAAILLVYVGAQRLFGSSILAFCVGWTAIVFTLNGSFSDVQGMYWGQLTPISHAADIALEILLPAVVVITFYFLTSETRRATMFFLTTWFVLFLMLTVAHIREVVQFEVYIASFDGLMLLVVFLLKKHHGILRKATLLLVMATAIIVTYGVWQRSNVGHTNEVVDSARTNLGKLAATYSFLDLVSLPSPTLMSRLFAANTWSKFFYGWFPVILLLSPLLLMLPGLRDNPLIWFCAISELAFLVITRFSGVSLLYVYFTYSEILYTPIRNFVFFIYLFAGAVFYLYAVTLARIISSLKSVLLIIMTLALGIGLITRARATVTSRTSTVPDLFYLPALILFIVAFIIILRPQVAQRLIDPTWVASKSALIIFLGLSLCLAVLMPLNGATPFDIQTSHNTLAELIAYPGCVKNACPPDAGLYQWAQKNLTENDILAVDVVNVAIPSIYFPVQVAAMPYFVVDPGSVFPTYYPFFKRAREQGLAQPFFNDIESAEDRLAFVKALGITKVFVDPDYYDIMKAKLQLQGDVFMSAYDDGHWAVYTIVNK